MKYLPSIIFIVSSILYSDFSLALENACSFQPESNPFNIPSVQKDSTYGVLVEQDIVYAEGLSHESTNSNNYVTIPLKLDVYSPINDDMNRPAFMFIHGGAFEFGSKQQFAIKKIAQYFASRGWVFFSIDYRLLGDKGTVPEVWANFAESLPQEFEDSFNAMYPAQRDAKAAMRWIVANKATYNINVDYITAGGASAGANTAKAIAVSDLDDFTNEISISDDPSLSTTNLGQEFDVKTIIDFWGGQGVTDAFQIVYGKNLFDPNDPVLYKAHGTADFTVPFSSALELLAIYDSINVTMDLDTLIGVGHGDFNATLNGKRLEDLAFDFIVEQQALMIGSKEVFPFVEPEFNPIPNSFNIESPNPSYALDIPYAGIEPDRQAFHLFVPDTSGTYPLVIYIHGGGFTGGSRDVVLASNNLQSSIKYFLERGIAFASIGYRLLTQPGPIDTVGVIKSLNDSKRALQFIRYHADALFIDPTKIALRGGSAGAGTALWLGTRDDMKDLSSCDPVLHSSTRVCAVAAGGSQSTYDLYKWETEIFNNYDGQGSNYTLDSMVNLLGFELASSFYGGLDSVYQIAHDPALIQYRQDVDMLYHMSDDDPPLFIESRSLATLPSQDLYHHSFHGRAIYNTAMESGISEVIADIRALNINTTGGETIDQFLERQLLGCATTTGFEDVYVEERRIELFPNPVVNQLTITGTLDLYKIEILDGSGQLYRTIDPIGTIHTIDLENLPGGLYLLRVINLENDLLEVQKIIKQ